MKSLWNIVSAFVRTYLWVLSKCLRGMSVGAAIHRFNNADKLPVFKRLGAKGILCLQETRWTQSGEASLQQRLNWMQVVHTPAATTDSGGLSGGAAILVGLGFCLIKHVVIQSSRIHAALLQSRTVTFWVINCFFTHKKSESLSWPLVLVCQVTLLENTRSLFAAILIKRTTPTKIYGLSLCKQQTCMI